MPVVMLKTGGSTYLKILIFLDGPQVVDFGLIG